MRACRPATLLRAAALLALCAAPEVRAQPAYTAPEFWTRKTAHPTLLLVPDGMILSRTGSPVARFTAYPDTVLTSRPADRWLGFDKVQHFTFSFLWTLGSQYALVNKLEMSERAAAPLSVGVSGGLGLAKEVYDLNVSPSRYFSRKDLVADAAGILLALGLIAL